ncbi:MAG: hypothetical protein IJ744_01480 [Lachnospiraceae bacterium]|nr:hypothetical protein [Lachnospiraceae bacterium]
MTEKERNDLSAKIVHRLASTREYRNAKTRSVYRATRGEANLKALEDLSKEDKKRFVFPLCVSNTEMIALAPLGDDSWTEG